MTEKLMLLLHADSPPEFKQTEYLGAATRLPPDGKGQTVTYESLGRVYTHVTNEEDDPQIVASCWMFAHPDVLAEIRENGDYRTLPSGDTE